jgi:hypothetical protein
MEANFPGKRRFKNPAFRYKIIRVDDQPHTIKIKETKRIRAEVVLASLLFGGAVRHGIVFAVRRRISDSHKCLHM